MKFLVSSVLLLFLAGTYGMAIHQQDEAEPQKPTLKDSVKNVLRQAVVFWAELVANWESPEDERVAVLNKRVEIIKKTYYELVYGLAEHCVDIYKEMHKEINETYPIVTNKVMPVLGSVILSAFETLRTASEEIKPYFEKFEEHVKTQQSAFWEEVRPIIQKKAKPILDALNANLKPFIEDVRKEVANAQNKEKEESKSPAEQDPRIALMEQNIQLTEFLQKILMFDKDLLKKMKSDLHIFNTNA